jgi:hypothetical protein
MGTDGCQFALNSFSGVPLTIRTCLIVEALFLKSWTARKRPCYQGGEARPDTISRLSKEDGFVLTCRASVPEESTIWDGPQRETFGGFRE